MYSSMDLANYIIYMCSKSKVLITLLKLQYIMYYTISTYLQRYHKYLTEEPILKHQYGPFIESVDSYYKVYKHKSIKEPISYILDSGTSTSVNFVDISSRISLLKKDYKLNLVLKEILDNLLNKDTLDIAKIIWKEPAYLLYEEEILKGEKLVYTKVDLLEATYLINN